MATERNEKHKQEESLYCLIESSFRMTLEINIINW